VQVILIGNKSDLEDKRYFFWLIIRVVTKEEAEKFASQ